MVVFFINNHTLYKVFVNICKTIFTTTEISLLNERPKFNPTIQFLNKETNLLNLNILSVEAESVQQSIDLENPIKKNIRTKIKNCLMMEKQ